MAATTAGTLRQHPRALAREVWRGVGEHDLLTFASAIAFQVMTALIPLAMFALALLGFLHLEDAWRTQLAPELHRNVPPEVYALANKVVLTAFGSKRVFWLTGGFLIMVWEISGAVRAIMDALSRIYRADERRPRAQRYLVSFALALGCGVGILLAYAVWRFEPTVVGGTVASILRWPVVLSLLLTVIWSLVRFAPAHSHAHGWVSFGSVVCVFAWLVTSAVFAVYVNYVADYGSIFSSLAVLFVALTYVYVSACAFLVGAQLDALVLEHKSPYDRRR